LATTVLGGGVAVRSLLAVEGIDSFADSALSDNTFPLLERRTSSSSLKLNKTEINSSKVEGS
jgi:hypothetical protein